MAEPPVKKLNASVPIPLSLLTFPCEWEKCETIFKKLDDFNSHMTQHLSAYFNEITEPLTDDTVFVCHWRECGSQVVGSYLDFLRHAYFHVFHVKIKSIGSYLINKTGTRGCLLDNSSRNLIPELPERLLCGWKHCESVYDNPEHFYRHVDNHAEGFSDGRKALCPCQWEGCESIIKSKSKMKEHLRSHSQEKIVACPTCGGLFANRTKLLDHLKRQEEAVLQCYQCSHCNKRFATERLLRDHMRNHVNHYKCPYCDMTCPSPSSLKNHIRYRHTEEKPFRCEHCNYCGKTSSDLRKHLESHTLEAPFCCHIAKCNYSARSYSSLANHYKRAHQSTPLAKYACHVCTTYFTRGSGLTKHLKVKHKFRWPSGHSRFRYKLDLDGFWRLQTVRYESIQLTEQVLSDQPHPDEENGSSSTISSDVHMGTISGDVHIETNENIPMPEDRQQNMSYNLEMLGDVALAVPTTESPSKAADILNSMSTASPVKNEVADPNNIPESSYFLITDSSGSLGSAHSDLLALQGLHNKKEYN